MTIEQTKIGWGFWLKWVLATTVGFGICVIVSRVVSHNVGEMIGSKLDNSFIFPFIPLLAGFFYTICAGVGVGIMQWLILRRRVSRVGWWAPSIVAGMVLASVLLLALSIARKYFLDSENFFALGMIILLSLGGTLAGVFQWFFLRRQISRAGWWVLASAVGWSLGAVVWFSSWFRFLGILNAIGLFFVIIMGAVTGGALVWLLRQPVNVK